MKSLCRKCSCCKSWVECNSTALYCAEIYNKSIWQYSLLIIQSSLSHGGFIMWSASEKKGAKLKSFSIKITLTEELLRRKRIKFLSCNAINLYFSKSKIEEPRARKLVPALSHEFHLLLLSGLQRKGGGWILEKLSEKW